MYRSRQDLQKLHILIYLAGIYFSLSAHRVWCAQHCSTGHSLKFLQDCHWHLERLDPVSYCIWKVCLQEFNSYSKREHLHHPALCACSTSVNKHGIMSSFKVRCWQWETQVFDGNWSQWHTYNIWLILIFPATPTANSLLLALLIAIPVIEFSLSSNLSSPVVLCNAPKYSLKVSATYCIFG